MKRFLLIASLLVAGCTNQFILSEEKVRVISSLDTCYKISLRNSDTINSIQMETDYSSILIADEWIPIYANQQALVLKSPFYCDLWMNNPDFIDKVKVLLKR